MKERDRVPMVKVFDSEETEEAILVFLVDTDIGRDTEEWETDRARGWWKDVFCLKKSYPGERDSMTLLNDKRRDTGWSHWRGIGEKV
jgi:hypothetical protein